MRQNIKKLIDATCVIDKTYFVRSRNMAAKPNIVVLMSAMDSDENLSQRKLHTDWLLPLSAINTIAAECRNAGCPYIFLFGIKREIRYGKD